MTERFNIVLYNRETTHENVNEGRWEMFCQKSWNLVNIAPSQDALNLHVMRAALQAGIRTKSYIPNPEIPARSSSSWEISSAKWMSLSEAAEASFALIKCKCQNLGISCKDIFNAKLPCIELCQCLCEK